MLDEYSIEQRAAQIFDTRSKEYFSEVLSCYAAGNHRSAVVMLWSVAVCDLLFKLQNLVDLYGDEKSKAILAEIGAMQEGWFHAKLLFVLGLSAYHGWMIGYSKKLARGERTLSGKQLRLFNEVPGIATAIIVVLVIAKPF